MKKLYSLALEQKEDAKHGDSFFPIQRYITTLNNNYPVITAHWHEEAELTMITTGSCKHQIDLVDYDVKEGDILFIPPLFLHSITDECTEKMVSDTYVFHLNFLGGNSTDICSTRYLTPMMNQEFSMPHLITPKHPAYASLKTIFTQINHLYDEAIPGYELAIKAMLLQVCFLLIQYSNRLETPDSGTPSDMLKKVLDYIELNYSEVIIVSELADICNFSDYHFMRFFKKYMGMSFMDYVNEVRFSKVYSDLIYTTDSVQDILANRGFTNYKLFMRMFKERYGTTPLQKRKAVGRG